MNRIRSKISSKITNCKKPFTDWRPKLFIRLINKPIVTDGLLCLKNRYDTILHVNPELVEILPPNLQTSDLWLNYLRRRHHSVTNVNPDFLTAEFYDQAFITKRITIPSIPSDKISRTTCDRIMINPNLHQYFHRIPKHLLTQHDCDTLTVFTRENFQHIPEHFLTPAIITSYNKYDSTCIEHNGLLIIPEKVMTQSIANDYAAYVKTVEHLDTIPAKFLTIEFYIHLFIYNPKFCNYMINGGHLDSVAKYINLLSITRSKFYLKCVEKSSHSIKDIPDDFQTQEMCTAAVDADIQNFGNINPRFITQDMCLRISLGSNRMKLIPPKFVDRYLQLLPSSTFKTDNLYKFHGLTMPVDVHRQHFDFKHADKLNRVLLNNDMVRLEYRGKHL